MWYTKRESKVIKAKAVYGNGWKIEEASDKTTEATEAAEVNGWKWFETEDEAYSFFGIVKPDNAQKGRPERKRINA